MHTEATIALRKATLLDQEIVFFQDMDHCHQEYLILLDSFQTWLEHLECNADNRCIKLASELTFLTNHEALHFADSVREVILRWVCNLSCTYNIQDEHRMQTLFATIKQLSRTSSLPDMFEILKKYLLAEFCDDTHNSVNNKILLDAISYIRLHFTEQDLSLSNVADQIGISKDYLSRLFKKELNIGFSKYDDVAHYLKNDILRSVPYTLFKLKEIKIKYFYFD